MTAIPFNYTPDGCNVGAVNTGVYFYVLAAGAPSADTTVWDANFGASGYWRLKLSPSLHLIFEASFLGGAVSVDINGGAAIAPGAWYWTACTFGSGTGCHPGSNFAGGLMGQCWGPGGVTSGIYVSPSVAQIGDEIHHTVSVPFGIGVSLTSTYNNWPNAAGWEMAKGILRNNENSWFGGAGAFGGWSPGPIEPPTGDTTAPYPSNWTAYWTGRQAIGSAATLIDSTAGAYNVAAVTPPGLTINAGGPYA